MSNIVFCIYLENFVGQRRTNQYQQGATLTTYQVKMLLQQVLLEQCKLKGCRKLSKKVKVEVYSAINSIANNDLRL